MNDVLGVVWHHTATGPNWADGHVAALLRDGRRDLAGPLSQLGLERDGTFVVVATGKANHNGFGFWGNDAIGIEAYNNGKGEPWPAAQMDAYVRGTAAILKHLGLGADRMKGHRETDPGRKPDPTGIDLNFARLLIGAVMVGKPAPPAPPLPLHLEDSMQFVTNHKDYGTRSVFIEGDLIADFGVTSAENVAVHHLSAAQLAQLRQAFTATGGTSVVG
jgi:hypothetical protein